jgi:enoyl-CoA hydratase/carnithine racemase
MDLSETRYEIADGVATLTLSRPERMNAFTATMMQELVALFEEASSDDRVRAVIVTGAGRAFCAGADLGAGGGTFDVPERGAPVTLSSYRDGGGQVALAIHRCKKPVIAAINGPAVGVGITMTLPMDIRIAASDAKIGFVFARRGIVPEACSSWFLPRIVGMAKALELCLTGRVFSAADEAGSGLFNYVLPAGEVLPKARAIAREIADHTSAVSIALTRAMLWHGAGDPDPQTTFLTDSKCIFWCGQQPDAYEGVQSFLEKRPPRFPMSAASHMPDFYPWWKEPKV